MLTTRPVALTRWIVAIVLTALACAVKAAPFIYVAQSDDGVIAVIDAASNSVTATINVGAGSFPRRIAVNRTGTRAYSANALADTVSFLDLATNTVVTTVPAPSVPAEVVLSADETRLYVASRGPKVLSVIDIASKSTLAVIPLIDIPIGLALNPSGTKLYVLYDVASTVSVIDTATNVLETNLMNRPDVLASDFAVTPSGVEIYVANSAMRSVFDPPPQSLLVTAIPANGLPSVASIDVGDQPLAITFPAQTNQAYVATYSHVKVIDPASRAVVGSTRIPEGPTGIAYLPALNRLYVTNRLSSLVTVVDLATSAVVASIPVNRPTYLGVAPGTLVAQSNEPIPTLAVPGLFALVALCFALGWYVLRTNRHR